MSIWPIELLMLLMSPNSEPAYADVKGKDMQVQTHVQSEWHSYGRHEVRQYCQGW